MRDNEMGVAPPVRRLFSFVRSGCKMHFVVGQARDSEKNHIGNGRRAEQRAKRLLEIRAVGLSALLMQDTQLVLQHYVLELNDMKPDQSLLPEYFEAKTALNVSLRRRPARTIFAINKLRRLRKKEGNVPAFDHFEEMVKTSLDDLTITPHGYTRATFASRPHDDLWQLVDAQLRRLSDWATPDPYFKFPWLEARRKFQLLLDDLNEVA